MVDMRFAIAALLATTCAALRFSQQPASFEEWRTIHGKSYATAAESQARQVTPVATQPVDSCTRQMRVAQAVFEENRAFVLRHNAEAFAGNKT